MQMVAMIVKMAGRRDRRENVIQNVWADAHADSAR